MTKNVMCLRCFRSAFCLFPKTKTTRNVNMTLTRTIKLVKIICPAKGLKPVYTCSYAKFLNFFNPIKISRTFGRRNINTLRTI